MAIPPLMVPSIHLSSSVGCRRDHNGQKSQVPRARSHDRESEGTAWNKTARCAADHCHDVLVAGVCGHRRESMPTSSDEHAFNGAANRTEDQRSEGRIVQIRVTATSA